MPDIYLDLGCGDRKSTPSGYVAIDNNPRMAPDIRRDIQRGLPYCDSCVSGIRAHHVLEHISDIVSVLNECYRVLKPEGKLWIDGPEPSSFAAWSDPTHIRGIGSNLDWYLHEPVDACGLTCAFKTLSKLEADEAKRLGSVKFELEAIKEVSSHQHGYVVDLGGGISSSDICERDIKSNPISRFRDRLDLIRVIDIDRTLVGHVSNLILRNVDQLGLPFCDNSCHFVRARDFMEHMRDMTFVMNEIYRVLEPGGLFEIKGPAPGSNFEWGNPDHVRSISLYTLAHFREPIPNAGIFTYFTPIFEEQDSTYLYGVYRAEKSKVVENIGSTITGLRTVV